MLRNRPIVAWAITMLFGLFYAFALCVATLAMLDVPPFNGRTVVVSPAEYEQLQKWRKERANVK